jgi:ABC-2 type transport system permease protein
MHNLWLVAKHEYRRIVARRGFLFGTLAIPLGIALLIGLVIIVEQMGANDLPVGYVDAAHVLDAGPSGAVDEAGAGIQVLGFADEESALAALERKEIQAFFVLPPGYPETLRTELYYLDEAPSQDVWDEFRDYVRAKLVATLPAEVQIRVLEGPKITVRDISSNREFSEHAIINLILPFAASAFFFIATLSAAGYMLGVVADEKENRTMEVLVTSVTPGQLIGGKAIGLLAAALTQLLIYVVAVVIGIRVAALFVEELQQATVPWMYLGIMALFFFPAYTLIASIMVAIGAAVTEFEQGQQAAGLLNIVFMLPLFLLGIFFSNPGHWVLVLLTLFPTTAFMTVSLRWGLGSIPWWQLGASWLLLVATSGLLVWVAAKIFRAGMLRYGQPLSFKAVAAAVRSG